MILKAFRGSFALQSIYLNGTLYFNQMIHWYISIRQSQLSFKMEWIILTKFLLIFIRSKLNQVKELP